MMHRVSLFFLFLLAPAFNALSTHIVGGEIEMVRKRGNVHQIVLKMYADMINGAQATSLESAAWVGIFDKTTHKMMDSVKLSRRRDVEVNYAKCPGNYTSPLKTQLLIFYEDVLLGDQYNNPAGYYISWQNCCRNKTIQNIIDPENEGMAFYLEFPPLVKNGEKFYNNSPQFPQIVGDYPCKDRPFIMNFSGVDPDGDSLVYRVANPLAGFAVAGGSALPTSGPYPQVIWKNTYGLYNQIPGTPSLSVNPHTGEIYFTPTQQGLFVFSIAIDEYRNGEKIGMAQRDFQLLVDNCPSNDPTKIELKFPDGSTYNSHTDTLRLNIEQDTCFSVSVSDQNPSEHLSLFIIDNTIPPEIVSFPNRIRTGPANTPVDISLCLSACNKLFISNDTIFRVSLVVTDAPKCPISLAYYDTLHFIIHYKPQINAAPTIGSRPPLQTIHATVGKTIFWDVFGKDDDKGDILNLTAQGIGFNLEDKKMNFNNASGNDSIGSRFSWTPTCEDLTNEKLQIQFVLRDNSCIPTNQDTLIIDLYVSDTITQLNDISPDNLFTPNGDGLNDYFEISNIPDGNCEYFFKNISIYNRWGAKVYENTNPHFRWNGYKMSSGLYFYVIDLNKTFYKGWVQLVR